MREKTRTLNFVDGCFWVLMFDTVRPCGFYQKLAIFRDGAGDGGEIGAGGAAASMVKRELSAAQAAFFLTAIGAGEASHLAIELRR